VSGAPCICDDSNVTAWEWLCSCCVVLQVRPTANMLTSDLEASGFWSPTPECIWRHNAAAGCSHFGFWWEFPDTPTGASFVNNVFPFRKPLGGAFNNSAHSNGQNGMHLYPQYRPQVQLVG
jgi:hypothetical protein